MPKQPAAETPAPSPPAVPAPTPAANPPPPSPASGGSWIVRPDGTLELAEGGPPRVAPVETGEG